MPAAKVLLGLLAMAASPLALAGNWTPLNSGTTYGLNTVWFTDPQTGYAAGAGGILLKTVNGGAAWQAMNSNTTQELLSLRFLDQRLGFSLGRNGLLKTEDGGENWTVMANVPAGRWSCQFIQEAERIYLAGMEAGGKGLIARTLDGGSTWALTSLDSAGGIDGIHFPEPRTGYAATVRGEILKSADGGDSWVKLPRRHSTMFHSVHFTSKDTGMAVGGYPGLIARTVNGGTDWLDTPVSPWLTSVHFSGALHGGAVGMRSVMMTADGGENWSETQMQDVTDLRGIHFPRPDLGYAVGLSGQVIKYTGDPSQVLAGPEQGRLFARGGRLSYRLEHNTPVRVRLFDPRGVLLTQLWEAHQESGTHCLDLRHGSLPIGTFLEFQAGGRREVLLVPR